MQRPEQARPQENERKVIRICQKRRIIDEKETRNLAKPQRKPAGSTIQNGKENTRKKCGNIPAVTGNGKRRFNNGTEDDYKRSYYYGFD